ncbi:unnamed protein product [Polarella glacialis]|uniref:ATP-grasp domain-containing protein n=1 Tax=Polarella glacialis TaxID=89957 RepID=A0A813LPP4_POLGL|nr:unnamed protein product [Polarella glacialis]
MAGPNGEQRHKGQSKAEKSGGRRGCLYTFAALCVAALAVAFSGLLQSVVSLAGDRPNGATTAAWSGLEVYAKPVLSFVGLNAQLDHFCSTNTFIHLLRDYGSLLGLENSTAQWNQAQKYYEEQRPIVEQAAKNFDLHGYWDGMAEVPLDTSLIDLLALRVTIMKSKMDNEGREDFRIEKDKCDMLQFLKRNDFPIPQVFGVWRDTPANFVEEFLSKQAVPSNASWPVFLKSCHLTQGVEDSVRKLPSREAMTTQRSELTRYVEQKWNRHAVDVDRSFARDGNALTGVLQPGVALQANYPSPNEFKIVVLWGRAYLAYDIENEGVVLRDGTFEQGSRARPYGTGLPTPITEIPHMAWLIEEGHLERMWRLAEVTALAIGIDQIRIDVFIRKGEPEAINVNEISLSSGQPNHMHTEFMAKLWVEPHVRRWPRSFPATTPVHLMDFASGEIPNQKAVLEQWDPTWRNAV